MTEVTTRAKPVLHHAGTLLVALLSTGALGGCVMLPLPPLGAQRGMEEIGSLEIGSATREDVRQALGNPEVAVSNRYEIFDLSEERFNLFLLTLLSPYIGGLATVGEARHRVLAEYGLGDVLHSLHWEALVEEGSVAGQAPPPSRNETDRPLPADGLRQLLDWEAPESWGSAVAVAPSGQTLAISYAVGEAEGRARSLTQVRDGRTGQLLQEIEYGPVGCPLLLPPERGIPGVAEPIAFLSDETHLVSLAREGTVCVWNFEIQRGVHALDAGEGDARRAATARFAPVLASADAEGLVKVWDGIPGREITSVTGCALEPECDPDGWSLGLALSDDGQVLATSHSGGRGYLGSDYRSAVTLTLWNASSGDELARVTLPSDGLMLADQRLAFSGDGSRLAVHLGDHVQVWRLGEPGPADPSEELGQRSPVELERVLLLPLDDEDEYLYRQRSLHFSGDGTRLIAGRGSVVAWETGTWRQVWRWVSPTRYSEIGLQLRRGFALPADGEVIVTARGVWQPEVRSGERENVDGEG